MRKNCALKAARFRRHRARQIYFARRIVRTYKQQERRDARIGAVFALKEIRIG